MRGPTRDQVTEIRGGDPDSAIDFDIERDANAARYTTRTLSRGTEKKTRKKKKKKKGKRAKIDANAEAQSIRNARYKHSKNFYAKCLCKVFRYFSKPLRYLKHVTRENIKYRMREAFEAYRYITISFLGNIESRWKNFLARNFQIFHVTRSVYS